ncbi:amidase [Mycobacteroides salmoniphilum]|uniref:amidase n=1 Tax=Mycobacteroides salmoniphilum TaxID=404941 RepID=UPI0010665402|nr:amidase [Mycobacteroides salmoniphilum]TDZ76886.1 6-aminohexanoate-cyclic-dimer hydrolase [Mycobacteroides salmoniphilum]TDZ86589.1 6-aminohexanoate-cyclic-dimer hydrolase [Mycobacteroides salmoniphilum]
MSEKRIHAFSDDALGSLDGVAIAEAIRSGALGHREVTEAAIARADAVNPTLNAVEYASYADTLNTPTSTGGPFSGVPTFIKDNVDVAGLPTRCGSEALAARPAKRTGPPAEQLLSQGFTLLGKSTLSEFALIPTAEYAHRPPTRNPWNTAYSTGGSSAGAAALVASGVVPVAHGNDGGGSIRIPAAATGLVGLKTTRGRILDQPGARRLPVNIATEGVLTRSVRDTAHYLAAAEHFYRNRRLPAVGLVLQPSTQRLRIAVSRTDGLGRPAHPDMQAAADSATEILASLGHIIVDVSLPDQINSAADDFEFYWTGLALLLVAACQVNHGWHFNPARLDPFTKSLIKKATTNPAKVAIATARLRRGTALYESQFEQYDLMLSPVLSQPVPLIGELSPSQPVGDLLGKLRDYIGFTPVNNVGGGPAIAIPHTITPSGLPGSVQLSAAAGQERALLEVAYELEAASPFPRITEIAAPARRRSARKVVKS